jgi:anti-sigma B factor antagonist
MELVQECIDGAVVLKLSGRFDAYAAPAVEKFLKHVDNSVTPWVIIDLAHVNFIDSTGLATLAVGLKRCREHEGSLVLCAIQQPVRIIFELTRLDKVFVIRESVAEVIESRLLEKVGESETHAGI